MIGFLKSLFQQEQQERQSEPEEEPEPEPVRQPTRISQEADVARDEFGQAEGPVQVRPTEIIRNAQQESTAIQADTSDINTSLEGIESRATSAIDSVSETVTSTSAELGSTLADSFSGLSSALALAGIGLGAYSIFEGKKELDAEDNEEAKIGQQEAVIGQDYNLLQSARNPTIGFEDISMPTFDTSQERTGAISHF